MNSSRSLLGSFFGTLLNEIRQSVRGETLTIPSRSRRLHESTQHELRPVAVHQAAKRADDRAEVLLLFARQNRFVS
jgi:hypothetical protein